MIRTLRPSHAEGRMTAPPSKSIAHRMIICAGLAEGESLIENIELSQDIRATIACMKVLGAQITPEEESGCRGLRIRGVKLLQERGSDGAEVCPNRAEGSGPHNDLQGHRILPCGESGSTLRFLLPLCLLRTDITELTGAARLLERPLSVYEDICRTQGLTFERTPGGLIVAGPLSAGDYTIPGNISSQFISGLLFSLPMLGEDSRIRLIPPIESRPYILMTLQALQTFGIQAVWEDETTIAIPGRQHFLPRHTAVEGDWSNAAFFDALNLTGGKVVLDGLREDSLQGDKIYRELYEQLKSGHPTIDISDCPDLGPVLIAAAVLQHGADLTGTARLRLKESDRALSMQQEIEKFGIRIEAGENEIHIPDQRPMPPATLLNSHNDHRIAMALAVLMTVTGGILEDAEAVEKSLPDFWERLDALLSPV